MLEIGTCEIKSIRSLSCFMTLEGFKKILLNANHVEDVDSLRKLCQGAYQALCRLESMNQWVSVLERTPTIEESTEIEGGNTVPRLLEVTVETFTGERYVGYAYYENGRWVRQDMVLDISGSSIIAWRIPKEFTGEIVL